MLVSSLRDSCTVLPLYLLGEGFRVCVGENYKDVALKNRKTRKWQARIGNRKTRRRDASASTPCVQFYNLLVTGFARGAGGEGGGL